MDQWHTWLVYVMDKLLDSAIGNIDLNFWERCVKHEPNGSGEGHMAGWMSSFNVFTKDGEWQAHTFHYWDVDGPVRTWFPVLDPD